MSPKAREALYRRLIAAYLDELANKRVTRSAHLNAWAVARKRVDPKNLHST